MAPHRSVYSARAKIGLIVPPTNTVNEAEWGRMMPDGVSFHTVRMPLHLDTESEAGRDALQRDLAIAMASVAQARVDVIAYACTAGSMRLPEDELADGMRAVSGIAAVTTAAAIVHAVRAMDVSRIALATPYQEATNRHEIAFLEACGIETVASSALGVKVGGSLGYSGISETPLETIREQARGVMHQDAQALVVSCTDYPVLTLIPELERELGVPVITSTTATLWAALRAVGIDDAVPGAGRLLGG